MTIFDKFKEEKLRELDALLKAYLEYKRSELKESFARTTSFGDFISDRWEKAAFYNFGEKSSCYDNVLVLGKVSVGRHCWIGPNVVLDGSGELEIGDFCHISAGAQLYSHHTVESVLSGGEKPFEYKKTSIGKNCYIGPNVVIQKGITIGDFCVIGANSFVNKDIPSHSKAFGTPAVVQESV